MEKIKAENPSLVLSGGGMKAAAYHIGVALALQSKGLSIGNIEAAKTNPLAFKRYVGTSAGAVIATFFAAGYSAEDIIYAFTQGKHKLDTLNLDNLEPTKKLPPLKYKDLFNLTSTPLSPTKWIPSFFSSQYLDWGGVESFIKRTFSLSGFFSNKGLGDYFRRAVFESESTSFKDMPIDLFIVATYLNKQKKAIFSRLPDHEGERMDYISGVDVSSAITASAALPPLFSPVKLNGEYFFDGEIRDSLSSHIALDEGSDLVVVSYSMQPYKFNDKVGSLDAYGIPLIANQALFQLIQQKIISHRRNKKALRNIFSTLESELARDLPQKRVKELMLNLEEKFFPDRKSKVIYIHPSARNYEMFFADHMSLKPKILNQIVTTGFKSAMNALRDYTFSK